jgi:LysM repeat protein
VPIRYVVPADAEIELWDSGMPVATQAGDTLPMLATAYHVPLWSLVQINRMSNNGPLAPGQHVIVPPARGVE